MALATILNHLPPVVLREAKFLIASTRRQSLLMVLMGALMVITTTLTYLPLIGLNVFETQSPPPLSMRKLAEVPKEEKQKAEIEEETPLDDEGITRGTLSHKPESFFQDIQQKIDREDLRERCQRYGFRMDHPQNNSLLPQLPRRIFYGSLIADEPFELLDIVAKETYGIFSGMVLVESNRTQTFAPRSLLWANQNNDSKQLKKLQSMFGVSEIQVRRFDNEDSTLRDLDRENEQRKEILLGWKQMGMRAGDVAYLSDLDETFTRDLLRAVQQCPYIGALDYHKHHCNISDAKIVGSTQVFEGSPECVTKDRAWYHPDIITAECVEGIGNEALNPIAPRNGYLRAQGYGNDCRTERYNQSFEKIEGNHFALWNAADFRTQCGGRCYEARAPNRSKYSAFHFHNFFSDFNATRRKYKTYGHPMHNTITGRLEDIEDDLKLTYRCALNLTDAPNTDSFPQKQRYKREVGGLQAGLPPWPIYFMDEEYRERKHKLIQQRVVEDEQIRLQRLSKHERAIELLWQEAQEAHRLAYDREEKIKYLREKLPLE